MPTYEQDESNEPTAGIDRRTLRFDHDGDTPRVLAGRYEVLEEIGTGATAITYRGFDRRLNRNVAIKILRQDHAIDSSFVQRFEREARAAASVSQGNVVDVYDFGEQKESLYIVMQYVDGEDLKRYIARQGPIEPVRARELTTQILAGLAAIHAAGIIHRDIKPQNVLIGRDGIARVTDFGVAQAAIDVGLTTAGTTVGTAAYMAPEQARAERLGEATDVYAVGVVLYEMLTGTMPFNAPTPVAMMLAHIQREPIPPSQKVPEQGISPDLDGIVMQAMAKDPADRFRSAGAMSKALSGVAGAGATTVLAAAVPGAQAEARAAQGRIPMATAWPAGQAAGSGGRRSPDDPGRWTNNGGREGFGMQGALGGLLLLLLFALAGFAAYLLYQYVIDGNTDRETPTVPAVVPTAISTRPPTEAPVVAPTQGSAPTQPPAVVPTAPPTEMPTAIPTDAPTPVPTEIPTQVPTEIPTEVPTETPLEQPTIEPVDNSSGGLPAQGSQSQASQGGRSASSPSEILIAPKAWQGDGVETASRSEWAIVGPGESATASFDISGTPTGDTFQISIALAAVDTQQVPLVVELNGNQMGAISDPLPSIPSDGSSQSLGSIVLTMPASALQDGRNEITIVNQIS